MILLHPESPARPDLDAPSRELLRKTVGFFEAKGKRRLKEDDHERRWYADFLDFVKRERVFATLLTPAQYGAAGARWDTARICDFAEILGFYGLAYWYTWQVSVLGLGPIWMSANEEAKRRAARLLEDGAIFAFGLSEKEHGADVYSTGMQLTPREGGGYLARGEKYYIGNGNRAAMVSTFGKLAGSGDYVFFAVDSQHPRYRCVRNVCNTQSYVSNYRLDDYPVEEADILSRGREAWDSALNTVNVGKFNLGWASIGICTHALYEAMTHAANRRLYGMAVTDFPHVKQLLSDAWARLVAMKLVALRAADYMRSASPEDRRYLLYNPVVKMKVTTQGENVIDHLWDVIAARGFENETYFEMAARDIRGLPKLEGTVHVNIALIVKFMPSYFFQPTALPEVPRRVDAMDDEFLFRQGPTRGLSQVRFHDHGPVFEAFDRIPNVAVFREQMAVFRQMLEKATPGAEQSRDIDFLLAIGEVFTLIVYAQLVLENAKILGVDDDSVDQIFDVFVRDFSRFAVQLHGKPATTAEQADFALRMIRRPVLDAARWDGVWRGSVLSLAGAYEMRA
jgi:acyl-CoA dehydrogenase